jgi:hypothetical protein
VLNAHWLSILQLKVGTELLGRVLSVNQMLATLMMPLGFLTAPLALDLAGHLPAVVPAWRAPGGAAGLVLAAGGVVLLVWAVLGLAYRPLRRLEDDLPDAVAGSEIPRDLDDIQRALTARR